MAYPYPTFTPGNWPKTNVNPVGTTTTYWAAQDATDVSGAVTQMMGYINTLSGAVNVGNTGLDTFVTNSFWPFSGSVVGKVGYDSWVPAVHAGEAMAVTLANLSSSYYSTPQPEVEIGYLSATALTMSKGLFNSTNLAAAMPVGAFPTGTYNNMWVSYWTLSGNFAALTGNVNSSASKWDTVSSSFNTLSGNLNSSASIWNAVSTSFWAMSASLNNSASIWNDNLTGILAGRFDTLSGNLNSSSSLWNNTSSSFWLLSGNLNSSASIWNANTTGALSTSFYTLSGNLNLSASTWNASAKVTSSNWQPVGAIFSITGSVEASSSLILHSPNGTRWNITIDNAGILSSTALP